MPKEPIKTTSAPAAIGPYSQAMRAGKMVFTSGQIPIDPATGEMVSGTIEEETARVMENIRGILSAAGLGFEAVIKTTIFITDMADFAEVNKVYGSYFVSDPPARSTVQVCALPKGARVEIEAIAVVYA
jgi:2-iminobutanoate/2-iminopropanoate deaminase